MPVFIAALLGGLVQAAGSLVGRVLIALGISFVAYAGVDTLLAWVQQQFFANIAGMPLLMRQVLGLLKVDVCANILFSAWAARMTLAGLSSGVVKRMVTK